MLRQTSSIDVDFVVLNDAASPSSSIGTLWKSSLSSAGYNGGPSGPEGAAGLDSVVENELSWVTSFNDNFGNSLWIDDSPLRADEFWGTWF